MINNKKMLLLCLVQYVFILAYHIIYSSLFCTKDQTTQVAVWSVCLLVVLVFFGYIFQKSIDLVVYVTMGAVLITVTYVGYILNTLAFSVLIYFAAGLILGMFYKKMYVIVWSISSFLALLLYTFIWPDIIKIMVPSLFLFYGYILCYLIGNICTMILVSSTERYFISLSEEKERAERDIKQKNIFWANISDEIRTPMNVINGMSRLLKSENLNVRAKEYTDQIENASDMLLTIVNDTLELSKVETSNLEIKHKAYDLYRVTALVVMYSSINITSDSLSIVYCVNPNVPPVLIGDEEIILKVMERVLNNALILAQKGEVRLDVDVAETNDKNKVDVIVTISDKNGGISEEALNNMFNSFEINGATRTTEQETVGLSLKLCKSMLALIGGEISVKSIRGEGTVFTIVIPQDLGEDFLIEDSIQQDSFYMKRLWKSPESKVLVVDDTPTNLKLLSGMIKLYGINTSNAESGQQCLDMMEQERYDLVFLDYLMPELNGEETLRKIKARSSNPNFKNVPIVAISGKSLQKDRDKFINMGFDEFITKPVDDKELENLLKRFLIKENR